MGKSKRMLFDMPGMIFDIFIRRFRVKNIKDFKIIWMGVPLPAMYIVLPNVGEFTPAVVLFDLRSTELRGVRVLILKNPPDLDLDGHVDHSHLDLHACVEVSETEDEPSIMGLTIGNKAKLYLEIHSLDMGIIHVTDEKLLYLNLYSSQMKNLVFELYLSGRYEWVEEYFKSNDGKFLPIKEDCYLLN